MTFRLLRYSLTLWFRTPYLPSKAGSSPAQFGAGERWSDFFDPLTRILLKYRLVDICWVFWHLWVFITFRFNRYIFPLLKPYSFESRAINSQFEILQRLHQKPPWISPHFLNELWAEGGSHVALRPTKRRDGKRRRNCNQWQLFSLRLAWRCCVFSFPSRCLKSNGGISFVFIF